MDFNNSGIKSPFSPRVRQSIGGRRPLGLNSAKKNHSKFAEAPGSQSGDVIYKTPLTTVETYGLPLPVMVTEALTFSSGEVSVRMSPCGWCWLVVGRRILAWPREPLAPSGSSPAPAGPVAARELTLPQTDLAHKADLVVLFYEDGAQMPSCIGVSPEGVVRYWRSVAQGGVYCDTGVELAGQECAKLTPPSFSSSGTGEGPTLALATTTCTVCLLTPKIVEGRPTVECRTLRPPSGWLGGIGRKVSLLFFGSMPAPPENKLVGIARLGGLWALVSGGPALQLWAGGRAVSHAELRPLLLPALQHKHQHLPGDQSSLEIIALDVRASGPASLLLLIATINVAREPDMRYALATISVEEPSSPAVTSLVGIGRWREEANSPPRCLPLTSASLVYNNNYIATVTANDKVEVIDVSSEGDRILGAEPLGAGLAVGAGPAGALVFSTKHGVLALTVRSSPGRNNSVVDTPMGSPCPSDMYEGNLTFYEIDPHEVSMLTTDACGKLKTAFLFHIRGDTVACRSILDQLFPPSPAPPTSSHSRPEPEVDAPLDVTIVAVAKEILDDMPAGDPRWKVRQGGGVSLQLGSSASLQTLAQLRDKRRALYMFLDFLRAVHLTRLTQLLTNESGSGTVPTEQVLSRLASCLHLAIALNSVQPADATIIDQAVYQVVCGAGAEWEEAAGGGLAAADVCWRRVSRVWHVVRALAHTHSAAHSLATLNILNSVLTEVCSQAGPAAGGVIPASVLPSLATLHRTALTVHARNCSDANTRSQLFEAGATLAHIVLADCEHLLREPSTEHLYEKMRTEAIQPFIEEKQMERARALAEKFRDFDLLIQMCVDDMDIDTLCSLIEKYSDQGMADKAFAHLHDMGGAGLAALVRTVGARLPPLLRAWLARAPCRAPLRAVLELSAGQYYDAAIALKTCYQDNTKGMPVSAVTTMASLAKLCLVAAPHTPHATGGTSHVTRGGTWREVEATLAQCELHVSLPRDLRLQHGLDSEDCPFMQPEELVQMYIESESSSLTEYDYKKALDLTDFIEDMERRDELRLRVWCASILRDSWQSDGELVAADQLTARTFFRLIDLVHIMGGDVALLLPALEDILTARELAELVSDPSVRYLLQYGYQCLHSPASTT